MSLHGWQYQGLGGILAISASKAARESFIKRPFLWHRSKKSMASMLALFANSTFSPKASMSKGSATSSFASNSSKMLNKKYPRQTAFGQPFPQGPQIFPHLVHVELGKLAALVLKVRKELRVAVQPAANLLIVFDPSPTFRRNRAHHVHPTRGHPLRRHEAPEDGVRRERILGQIDDPLVEVLT